MTDKSKKSFSEIWVVDFEYRCDPGENPTPHCMVAKEVLSGKKISLWGDELLSQPNFIDRPNSLYVSFYGSAEMSCHLALNWNFPHYLVDLFAEFKNLKNGLNLNIKSSLLGAMTYYGIPSIAFEEKKEMRELAMRAKGCLSKEELHELVEYCRKDVEGTERLFLKMFPDFIVGTFPLLRGEYVKAVACMEKCGVPIWRERQKLIAENFERLKGYLISKVNQKYKVYENGVFKENLFLKYLEDENIHSWPKSTTGKLKKDNDTFKSMVKTYPQLQELKELRSTLSSLNLNNLSIGKDARNRTLLSPFQSRTGRNQPSNAKFIFGPSKWIRGLIKPPRDKAIAYIDWSQQEFGIAAALSGDDNMKAAYLSEDTYLTFGKQAGAIPSYATKESHTKERNLFKQCVLAVQYGMGEKSLALQINKPESYARELLSFHKTVYKKFWSWSDSCLDFAMLNGFLTTVFGWNYLIPKDSNPRAIRNFPMQANGAEILRIACINLTAHGIKVCAPVHDAVLIEADSDSIEVTANLTQKVMKEASELVLSGFSLKSEIENITKYPNNYTNRDFETMWKFVEEALEMFPQ